uniref:Cyclin D3-2 n=1 Tax=Dimocarpus longan TaxID=128017 RepID=A0A8G0QX44_9ROSI|nr:cyclin D3-2 [Dimocarpus longan]
MKKMGLPEENTKELQSPSVVVDGLYCEEEGFEDCELGLESENCGKESFLASVLLEQDLFWEDSELLSLISKENETRVSCDLISDGFLMLARKEAVEWVLRVKAHYGFNALTSVLAVNYFDRFISSLKFQRDKPWMGQLAAVACLSLAAKVEETQVRLLLDLQVEDAKYVFEAKTIQRMELLVLSALKWKMNPVTPLSFFDHIVRRLGLKTHLHWEFLRRCERLLLSIIADSRFMLYLPSILATATMMHVIKEVEPCNHLEYQNQLMGVLKISEGVVNECYMLILELSSSHGSRNPHKRKHMSVPGSPNGVVDASFSYDSSNDSWALASSVSSSPEPRFKRNRANVQQMRLPSLNRTFVDVISSPR